MTQELIVGDVNFLDPRLIGLSCYFWSSAGTSRETLGVLKSISPSWVPRFHGEAADGGRIHSEYCRLAQGDKIPCKGAQQPVPDGVVVNLWNENIDDLMLTALAQDVNWEDHTYYQVKEQKLDDKPAVNVGTEGHIDQFVHMTPELLQRIDEVLVKAHNSASVLVDMYPETKTLRDELSEIEAVRKELEAIS